MSGSDGEGLSQAQLEILSLLSTGLTVQQVATRTYRSHDTVKSHLRLAYRTLGVPNGTAAVALLLRRGVIR
ncbi:MAG: LuxR C-terminal-related transcriptional regulator [Micrococcales bacterium]|nr:LuxR C-terminal-related transcriptional regulator [Micrococcales bacterium]